MIYLNNSFNETILTHKESKTLKYIARHKRVEENKFDENTLNTLYEQNFISYNLSSEYVYGSELRDGTVSVTDTYTMYKKYKRKDFIKKFFGAVITILTLVISALQLL